MDTTLTDQQRIVWSIFYSSGFGQTLSNHNLDGPQKIDIQFAKASAPQELDINTKPINVIGLKNMLQEEQENLK